MNALPDYIVIEFFNWIKSNESSHLNIGYVRECVTRDRHTYSAMEDLASYAKKFIVQKRFKYLTIRINRKHTSLFDLSLCR